MASADEIAILRIELQGIEPLIWRRVAVSTAMNLMDLNRVIQAAMGWLDSHLWELEANSRRYSMRLPSEPEWNERYEDAETVTLESLLHDGSRRMNYVYDIGDYWEHALIVERVTAPLLNVTYPQFLGGERRCPPEDCGGPHGYYEFLKNISSKERRVRDEALRWYGGPYDPDDIDASAIAGAFERIGRRRARR
jgi:hypothetical protein